jgi:hypothetical protein
VEQIENRIAPEASTDERASSIQPHFATPAERAAFFAGVATALDAARSERPPATNAADILDFEPVDLRYRVDGFTPEKQRAYVEAYADTGVARHAAALVGISEQSVARLRRRPEARGFDLACEAAQRIGARRVLSVAVERAIEGTIKRHYYHGELKSEERVYDNKLLAFLIGKLGPALEPREDSLAVEANWEPWVGAIERGEPPPVLADAAASPADADAEPDPDAVLDIPYTGTELWDEDGETWTSYPPPAGFEGEEEGEYGEADYKRRLTDAEEAVIAADGARTKERERARACADRDRYFGFESGLKSPSREAEPYQPSVAARRARRRKRPG